MYISTTKLDGQENYQLLNGGITPRPIAWISTCSEDNIDNIAPFSFFTVASCNPPVLLFTHVNQRNGVFKDTMNNLMKTKECVVNIVNADLIEQMNMTSAQLSSETSEFAFANIVTCPSSSVKPLSVKDAPVRYECSLKELITISDLPAGGKLILLNVKTVFIKDELFASGQIDQEKITTVGRLGGNFYSIAKDKIELSRPK